MWGVELVVMGAMIAANSVFAAYEIALASVALTIIPPPTAFAFAKN